MEPSLGCRNIMIKCLDLPDFFSTLSLEICQCGYETAKDLCCNCGNARCLKIGILLVMNFRNRLKNCHFLKT